MEKQISTLKSLVRAAFYTTAGVTIGGFNAANAAIDIQGQQIQEGIKGSNNSAEVAIQNIIGNILLFIGILAVVYLLWGGFNILTAGGDEEKVKTGKTVIVQAGIGIVVIVLANSIVTWIVGIVQGV